MRILFFVLLISELAVGQVHEVELRYCAKMESDESRLACYDLLSQQYSEKISDSVAERAGFQTGAGKWLISINSNPIDDSKVAMAMLLAESGKSKFGRPVTLAVRCKGKNVDLIINWGHYISGGPVRTRIDKSPAKNESWEYSNNNISVIARSPIKLIEKMLDANSFIAQVEPYYSNSITAVFDIEGMRESIDKIRGHCKWK